MVAEKECDECGIETRIKHLGKINGQFLCRNCRVLLRKNHRKVSSKLYAAPVPKIKKSKKDIVPPKIKGSKKTRVDNHNCYITFEEKKNWFRILINKGVDSQDAKDRVNELVKSQWQLREDMLKQNKSEKEIKQMQSEMLEELWNT